MKKIISVRFQDGGKSYSFDPAGLDIHTGDFVIVSTVRGTECGEVTQGVHDAPDSSLPAELKPVVRLADAVDIRRRAQNRADEARAFQICQERIARHNLEMKLVEVEYTLDRSKILFYFTADGRVDFRELVKDLAGVFHTRIELRQIGVRDESKMLGGLGICGQPFCCSRFLKDFQPVSIKMAKLQNLSLNPAKISGTCGRLMCCLAYEQKAYEYLTAVMPTAGSTVRTPDGVGFVLEVSPIAGTLKVRTGADSLAPKVYRVADCEYISGGKHPPRAPDPDDDYSGMGKPFRTVAEGGPDDEDLPPVTADETGSAAAADSTTEPEAETEGAAAADSTAEPDEETEGAAPADSTAEPDEETESAAAAGSAAETADETGSAASAAR